MRNPPWHRASCRLAVVALALAMALAGPPTAAAGMARAAGGDGAAAEATAAATPAHSPAGDAAAGAQQDLLDRHARRIDDLRRTAEMLLGPLPAVAATPFFGLAALSAAGLAARSETVQAARHPWVRAFRDNALIRESQRYASWPLLLTFLALALITFLANSGKVRGVAGKLLRVIEDSSSTLIYFALSVGALKLAAAAPAATAAAGASGAGAATATARTLAAVHMGAVHMGFVDGSIATLIALGLSIGLAAMMVTRYACDVLIWLIPVPFIDFGFEALKKLLTVGFLCLYLFAPGAAAALAFVLLLPALAIAPWALRVLGFAFHVLLRPGLAWLLPALRPQILDPHLVAHYGTDPVARRAAADLLAAPPAQRAPASQTQIAGVVLAADAIALQVARLPRRTHGCLLRTPQGVYFVTVSPFGRRRAWPLLPAASAAAAAGAAAAATESPTAAAAGAGPAAAGGSLSLASALLWTELRAVAPDGTVLGRVALPRSLDRARLAALLGAAGDPQPPRQPLPATVQLA
jgi:hypothetical protein